mmetsp:Transcript_68405/g.154917  ORF Transcript_68405/g.154917 Transcript_68405/m.154917 type:complete len:212 (-) Transcript_68405:1196-1831(-)
MPTARCSKCKTTPRECYHGELQEVLKGLVVHIVLSDLLREDDAVGGHEALAVGDLEVPHFVQEALLRTAPVEALPGHGDVFGLVVHKEACPLVHAPQPREVVPAEDDDQPVTKLQELLYELDVEPLAVWIILPDAALVYPEAHLPPTVRTAKMMCCQVFGGHAELRRLDVSILAAVAHQGGPVLGCRPRVAHKPHWPSVHRTLELVIEAEV